MSPPIIRLLLSIIFLITLSETIQTASAQVCDAPPFLPFWSVTRYTWPANTGVQVFIDDDFDDDAYEDLKQGFLNWNYHSVEDCSNVTFYGFERVDLSWIGMTDLPPSHQVWVVRQPTDDGSCCQSPSQGTFDGKLSSVKLRIAPSTSVQHDIRYFTYVSAHEMGHFFGINHDGIWSGINSVMSGAHFGDAFAAAWNASLPTYCDVDEVKKHYCCLPQSCPDDMEWSTTQCECVPYTQEPCENSGWYYNFTQSTNNCSPTPHPGLCSGTPDWGHYPSTGCYSGFSLLGPACGRSNVFINHCYGGLDGYDPIRCVCTGCDWCGGSPVLIDVAGDGFSMTNVINGVLFDLNDNGTRDRLSWTAPNTDDAWLTLDRNHNGVIDSGKELFGDLTSQPPSDEPNGFLALDEFDWLVHGGNGDGVIDRADSVFLKLRLWQDTNHNGTSESSELHSLSELGVTSIDLKYKESKLTDSFGNRFKYRAKVRGIHGAEVSRWAWDVFLLSSK